MSWYPQPPDIKQHNITLLEKIPTFLEMDKILSK